jgi:penicillin-insensitive murein endopeptidase
LKGGVSLPKSGKNFQSYNTLGNLFGRTYIHSKVRHVVLNAYKNLESNYPEKVFMYGETGWKDGGRFKPHKTHQNGLSVDFMVPVLNENSSVYLPTSPFNKFGYNIEFDDQGKYEKYAIDFEAIATHLVELHKEARAANIDIWRVIFAPKLQPYLFQTKHGKYLKKKLEFSKKPSWVRHDEHYHVDFEVECKKL